MGPDDDTSAEDRPLTDTPVRAVAGGLALPPADADLRPNPLLGENGPRWPSDRYRDEYAAGCAWTTGRGDPVRTRRLVDLPERW